MPGYMKGHYPPPDPVKGYWTGGIGGGVDKIDKTTYATDTNSYVGALVNGRYAHAAVSGPAAVFVIGGSETTKNTDKITFATDAAAALADNANQTWLVCVNRGSTNGYYSGGYTAVYPVSTIKRFTYASESSATLAATLVSPRTYHAGFTAPLAGYFQGGMTYTSDTVTTEKLTFSSETESSVGTGDLPGTKNRASFCGDGSTKAFNVAGLYNGTGDLLTQKFTFSNETCSAAAGANLSAKTWGGAGQSAGANKGYAAGGFTYSVGWNGSNVITKINYSTETASVIAATVSSAQYYMAGAGQAMIT